VAAQAWDEVLTMLRREFVQLGAPADPSLAAAWTALLPPSMDAEPEVLLAQIVARTVANPEGAYEVGRKAVATFAARGDLDGEVAALARIGAVAYALMDGARRTSSGSRSWPRPVTRGRSPSMPSSGPRTR
jgi:hypothetical protein